MSEGPFLHDAAIIIGLSYSPGEFEVNRAKWSIVFFIAVLCLVGIGDLKTVWWHFVILGQLFLWRVKDGGQNGGLMIL